LPKAALWAREANPCRVGAEGREPLRRFGACPSRSFWRSAASDHPPRCFGVGLAFFGGTYVAAIAAVEAFRLMGWQRTWADLKVVLP
jgi:hypothetical protein